MLSKQLHWLEIAEYIAIASTLISLLVAIASGNLLFSIVCLSVALVLNPINRFRAGKQIQKRLTGTIKRIQRQLSEEIQTRLAQQEIHATNPTNVPQIDNDNLVVIQESLTSQKKALESIFRYLNNHVLPERIEPLEQSIAELKQQILELGERSPDNINISPSFVSDSSLSFPLPQLAIPLASTPSNWTCIHTLDAHTEAVASLAIGPDNLFLASASWDRNLKLWDMATGNLVSPTAGHSQGILAVVFLDRYRLATSSFDRTIKIWLLEPDEAGYMNLRLDRSLTEHKGSIHALALARQRQILISGSYDQTIKQWDLATGKILKSSSDDSGVIYAITVNEATQVIASAGGDGRIALWQLETGSQLACLTGNISSVESLAISPEGLILAAGCVDGHIRLWQLEPNLYGAGQQFQPIRILNAHAGPVKSLLFNPDGQTLLSGGGDGTIKTWHPESMEAIDAIAIGASRPTPIYSLALSSDGQFLAAGSADGKIKIWQPALSA